MKDPKQTIRVIINLNEQKQTAAFLKSGSSYNMDELENRYINLIHCVGGNPIVVDLAADHLNLSYKQQKRVRDYLNDNYQNDISEIYMLTKATKDNDLVLANSAVKSILEKTMVIGGLK